MSPRKRRRKATPPAAASLKQKPDEADELTESDDDDNNSDDDGDEEAETDESWRVKFELVQQFRREHGHTRIPQHYTVTVSSSSVSNGKSNKKNKTTKVVRLGEWVHRQRRQKRAFDEAKAQLEEHDGTAAAQKKKAESTNKTTYETKWRANLEVLRRYRREFGHCRVAGSTVYEGVALGNWVRQQRSEKKKFDAHQKAYISQERIDQLNALEGFVWEVLPPKTNRDGETVTQHTNNDAADDEEWRTMLELLQQYKNQHGHCRVPKKFVVTTTASNDSDSNNNNNNNNDANNSVALGEWVSKQRREWKKLRLGNRNAAISQERIQQLEAMGFDLLEFQNKSTNELPEAAAAAVATDEDGQRRGRKKGSGRPMNEALWLSRFELLKRFQSEKGYTNVPQTLVYGGVKLGVWVLMQRRAKKELDAGLVPSTCITPERIERLESIGFDWGGEGRYVNQNRDAQWQKGLDYLRAYRQEHGDCLVPRKRDAADGFRLGEWVKRQRDERRKFRRGATSSMTQARIDRLDEIGFTWKVDESQKRKGSSKPESDVGSPKQGPNANNPRATKITTAEV